MLTRVAATDGWHLVGHASSHLHVVSPAHSTDVRVCQDKVLQLQLDLTNLIIHWLYHETANCVHNLGTGKYLEKLNVVDYKS